ncbi:MAG: lipoyl synthase [Duodenibacillus sp.]
MTEQHDGASQRGADKVRPLRLAPAPVQPLKKPVWLRVKALQSTPQSEHVRRVLREQGLSSVCNEAYCPNIAECFEHGTATFLIMGKICTRRCPFCDIAHGRPAPLDSTEPERLAAACRELQIRHVVVTSVDRDDLSDGGAGHFAQVIRALRRSIADIHVEILVPDFRGRMEPALEALTRTPPDVFNHNVETVPRLYRTCRPGSDYRHSLELLRAYKERNPHVLTKSGLMLGLGETDEEVEAVLADLRENRVNIVTIGQYLAPSSAHLPVREYVSPERFQAWQARALAMGFTSAFCGVFVRSSYHAAEQVPTNHE